MESERDKYYLAIDGVIINFAALEDEFFKLFALLNNSDLINSTIISSKIPFGILIDITCDLIKNNYKEIDTYREELETIISKVRKSNTDRNDIVHSHWIGEIDKTKPLYKYRIKPSVQNNFTGQIKEVTIKEIENTSQDIFETYRLVKTNVIKLGNNK